MYMSALFKEVFSNLLGLRFRQLEEKKKFFTKMTISQLTEIKNLNV